MARSECFEDMMTCINSVQSTSIVYIYNHIDIYIYTYSTQGVAIKIFSEGFAVGQGNLQV